MVHIKYNGIETLTTLHPDEDKIPWGTCIVTITYGSHCKVNNITAEKVGAAFEHQRGSLEAIQDLSAPYTAA